MCKRDRPNNDMKAEIEQLLIEIKKNKSEIKGVDENDE